LTEAVADIIDMHTDLVRPDDPRGLSCNDQKAKIDYREKQHRIRYVMFEKPDHVGIFNNQK
jgi:hypothetical protein